MGKSSTERSRERRARIYSNKKLHDELKEKERARKKKDWIMRAIECYIESKREMQRENTVQE